MDKKKSAKIKEWWRKNWKWVAGVAGTVALGVLKVAFESRSNNGDESYTYTDRWMKSASDDELDNEREKVRVKYCSSGDDFAEADRMYNLLHRFDKEMSDRAWGDEEPRGPSCHREHGYYLPNDD